MQLIAIKIDIIFQVNNFFNIFAFSIFFTANLASVVAGITLGWTSPMNEKFKNLDESPLDKIPSDEELSWIASLVALGALIGKRKNCN